MFCKLGPSIVYHWEIGHKPGLLFSSPGSSASFDEYSSFLLCVVFSTQSLLIILLFMLLQELISVRKQ